MKVHTSSRRASSPSPSVTRFAAPGAALGNHPSAPMFITHALLCLRAASQNLRRAEAESAGSTGKARTRLGLVIGELEDIAAGKEHPVADQITADVLRDEEG